MRTTYNRQDIPLIITASGAVYHRDDTARLSPVEATFDLLTRTDQLIAVTDAVIADAEEGVDASRTLAMYFNEDMPAEVQNAVTGTLFDLHVARKLDRTPRFFRPVIRLSSRIMRRLIVGK